MVERFVLPLSFCIPESKIVSDVPIKTKYMADIIPGRLETYKYTDEGPYYADYQTSVFGTTTKKAGWDCMRHYEILANGCLPWFPDLQQCPANTMRHFPKALVWNAMQTIGNSQRDFSKVSSSVLHSTINELLAYTHAHLTTTAMVKYIIESTGHQESKRTLFLSGNTSFALGVDYARCLTLHGFKSILGANCVDFPRISHVYRDYPLADARRLYGKGMSCTRDLPISTKSGLTDEKDVIEAVKAGEFDLVVYGSVHRGQPLWETVIDYVDPANIVLLCGEDLHGECPFIQTTEKQMCHLMLREQR